MLVNYLKSFSDVQKLCKYKNVVFDDKYRTKYFVFHPTKSAKQCLAVQTQLRRNPNQYFDTHLAHPSSNGQCAE